MNHEGLSEEDVWGQNVGYTDRILQNTVKYLL